MEKKLTPPRTSAATQDMPWGSHLPETTLPARFGRYEMQRLLGRGGMGTVYHAFDTELRRDVALKIPNFQVDCPNAIERFLREGRAAAALRHPGICPVYDVGQVQGTYFLSMGYIEGQSIAAMLKNGGPLSAEQAVRICVAVARAMQAAHDHGVVHRDLKPSNIMVGRDEQVVVLDFGVAYQQSLDEHHLTQTGCLAGTPKYMSPEQAAGDRIAVGPASDIYSLGVILYELLTGRVPFQGEGVGKLLAQIERDAPTPPSQFRPDLHAGLESVCLKALSKQPTDRFATMADFAAALVAFDNQDHCAQVRQSTIEHSPKPNRPYRRKLWAIGVPIVVALLLGSIIYFFVRSTGDLEIVSVDGPESRGKVDVTLRNLGEQSIVITAITITNLEDDGCRMQSGRIRTSAKYHIPIDDLKVGESRSIPVSHSVDPHGVDKILIDLTTNREWGTIRLKLEYNRNQHAQIDLRIGKAGSRRMPRF
jgi:serine/threonine protein kinase